MHLGIRLLFAFFVVTGLAGFFVLRGFVTEVKPSVREVMEDMMVDTANILAELAADDLVSGRLGVEAGQPEGHFARQVNAYARRPVDAQIWGLTKQTLDYRVYVTDARGKVLFDSTHVAVGQDFSQWRDVARTLRGEYGARATREVQQDDRTSVLYVAAPVLQGDKVIGVLTVAKPVATVQAFIDRAERHILLNGLWLLALSTMVGVAVTLWLVWRVRQLRDYANAVGTVGSGQQVQVPQVPGELGELARAMDAMRQRVQGRDYIEAYVRALTHELKSPLAALRGAGELLQDELPPADRRAFTDDVLAQTARMQALVDRLLELSRLEHRQALAAPEMVPLQPFLDSFARKVQAEYREFAIKFVVNADDCQVRAEPALLGLALANLVNNAVGFAPAGSTVRLEACAGVVAVQDTGPGVPDFALPRLGERFFSTPRPGGGDHAPPTGLTKGSGLGLAIVRQIMALHGGSMCAFNTTPGLRVELHFPDFTPASHTSS
jgi:two-component system sensor histidine kinase CreC